MNSSNFSFFNQFDKKTEFIKFHFKLKCIKISLDISFGSNYFDHNKQLIIKSFDMVIDEINVFKYSQAFHFICCPVCQYKSCAFP